MNLQNIFNDIQAADPEFSERISPRRNVIKNMARVASMAAVPLALGSLLKKAYGKNTGIIDETLNFALRLERLEFRFYELALNTVTLQFPTQAARDAITVIRNHEQAHVTFLENTINGMGVPLAPIDTYDFTGGNGANNGPFAQAFSNYALFLAVAQVFEDTGVRAYKGQAGNLMSNDAILTAALQIHSVEARHAAHIRYMRRNLSGANLVEGDIKPWITGNQSNIANNPGSAAIQRTYNGEDLATQATVAIAGGEISVNEATEAFDEPLDKTAILTIVDPFIVG